jgi:hypothetical protein
MNKKISPLPDGAEVITSSSCDDSYANAFCACESPSYVFFFFYR